MKKFKFTDADIKQIQVRGQTVATITNQLERFEKGPRSVQLVHAATVDQGIKKISSLDSKSLVNTFESAAHQGRVTSFIPASGAATRMFKGLTSVLLSPQKPSLKDLEDAAQKQDAGNEDAKELLEWWDGIKRGVFPFHLLLVLKLYENNLDLNELIAQQNYRPVLETLLTNSGLHFSDLPKALIPFHFEEDGPRLSLEVHLRENSQLVTDENGKCKLHFTVSPEHEQFFREQLDWIQKKIAAASSSVKPFQFEIKLSHQKPETDTIAVDENNQPIRNVQNEIVFRPGGHGALLKNLEATQADILFIKNIDNVVTDIAREKVILFRKVMGGYLIEIQNQIFYFIKQIDSQSDSAQLQSALSLSADIQKFLSDYFGLALSSNQFSLSALKNILHRPLRVCAMVKNQGEPGGGPFWVKGLTTLAGAAAAAETDGKVSLQIVESSQVDKSSSEQKNIFISSTHFNPVDMVCGLKNVYDENFNLEEFVDHESYFITTKSFNGKTIKALELPGLWNGSMAYWNTIFIEAPVDIFNPVKTVNDLLRPSHQTIYNRV